MVAWLGAWNRAQCLSRQARQLARLRPAHFRLVIALLKGLSDPVVGLSMGQTAERLAWEFGISRQQMDVYALKSHRRLANAVESGWLDEIEPMIAADGALFTHDEGLRVDSTLEGLGRLKPVFDRPVGKVTAGNSAQITDGAALLILASKAAVKQHRLHARARLIDVEWAALDPAQMGLGPVHAMAGLLRRQGLGSDDIDYWEINEAFAAQVLACCKAWESERYFREQWDSPPFGRIDPQRLNVDGGGISLGHPVGASGARIVLHLMKVLERNQAIRGMASLCIGGGQGGALLIEQVGE